MGEKAKVEQLVIVETKKPKKKKRSFKARVEPIQTGHIVEVWRFFMEMVERNRNQYLYIEEEDPHDMRRHLFNYMSNPDYVGYMVKQGRRITSFLQGQILVRPFGRPKKFYFIWNFYVHPDFRGAGHGKLLIKKAFEDMRKNHGIVYWEGEASDKLTKHLVDHSKFQAERLFSRIGGKC